MYTITDARISCGVETYTYDHLDKANKAFDDIAGEALKRRQTRTLTMHSRSGNLVRLFTAVAF